MDDRALLDRVFHPKRRVTAGKIYRACERSLSETYSRTVLDAWWLGRRVHTHDQRDAAAIAWEALASAELIPMEWITDDMRMYERDPDLDARCPDCDGKKCPHCYEWHQRSSPWTLVEVATFASDPTGISTAEVLAKEWHAQEYGKIPTILWRTLDPSESVSYQYKLEKQLPELPDVARALLETGYGFSVRTATSIRLLAQRV